MQIFEGVGIALDSIRSNKGRASLTILGIAIGVAVVMVIAAMITGINRGVTDIVEQLGPRTFFVVRHFQGGIQVSDGSDEMSPWRRKPPLTLEEAERIEQLPNIEFVVVNNGTNTPITSAFESLESVSVQGRGVQWPAVSGGDIFPGRSFTHLEYAANSRVAVINEKLAERLFGHLDPMGRNIQIAGMPYRVIGIYTPPPDLFGEGDRPQAILPFTTYDKHVPHWRGWLDFMVSPREGVPVSYAMDEVTGAMRSMRGLKPGVDNNFDIITQDKILSTWNDMTGIFFLVMFALSSVGLMVGGVGVVAIMMISVTERTREIGVRKALGAKRREILWQFLVEAATLTFVGGVAGLILGGGLAAIARAVTPLPAVVPMWSIVIALAASVFTGVGFGLFPAFRASRLDPVEALRYE
ncbi:MAG: ABC transporter permease [Gemmatimonadota bacterium]|nr:ABC transporter permease [Gemmatimonadota bacterium]MDH5803999.1 ABC transporter permease [Gemmatimonadota bacterium]